MTSLFRALQRIGHGIARTMRNPSSQRDRPMPFTLAVHHKMVLLGTWLLLSCAVVAAMGIWGVSIIERDQSRLTRHELPGLTQLLRTDIDLYEAQLGLERAAETNDPLERKDGLDFFYVNITESDEKFTIYKTLAIGIAGEAAAVTVYEADHAKWLGSAEELASELANTHNSEPRGGETEVASGAMAMPSVASKIEAEQALFQTMRGRLNRILVGFYEPAIEASGNQLDHTSSLTCWELVWGSLVAIVAGAMLTRSMARVLRVQQQATEAMNGEQAEQTRRQVFEARLTRGLEMAQDEDAALRLVEQAIVLAAPAVNSEILLADSSRAHLHQAAKTGEKRQGCGCRVPKPSDCPAVRRGHRLNFESGGMFDACPHLKNRPGGDCSAVCIPLSIMGQTVGVLHVTAEEGHLPPENQIQALEQVASKSGERIGLLRAFQRTQAQASKDPLTGLLNRRSLEEKVHELTRQNTPFAVAYGDLDHFKNLNDTHGHETGDKALRTFAQVLKTSIRPQDLAARWGGEEFVLVLPLASPDDAVAILDRVRQALSNVLRDANTPLFTVSFGVARTGEGTVFEDVLACADESLLRAKKEGRNRTIRHPDHVPARRPATPAAGQQPVGEDGDASASAAA